MKTHQIWVKKSVLPHIQNRRKGLELRPKTAPPHMVEAGDLFLFNGGAATRTIRKIREYNTLQEMAEKEDPKQIFPGVKMSAILEELPRFYPPNAFAEGVRVFEFY